MLSKIETGNIAPSLTTLQSISKAFGLPLTALFRRFEEGRSASFVKAGARVYIERRGTRAGHQYSKRRASVAPIQGTFRRHA
jgi:transcriptional regulator with XRE-family HTH domain